MSLDTIIELGRIMRQEPDGIRYHRFVRPAPADTDKKVYHRYVINVNEDMQVKRGSLRLIKDEDFLKGGNFLYMAFKQGEADSYTRYVFGDICSDYFKPSNPNKKGVHATNSFERGVVNSEKIDETNFQRFRNSLGEHIEELSQYLFEESENWYLHFSFDGNTHWYEQKKMMDAVNASMLTYFFEEEEGRWSLSAFLVRTLINKEFALPGFSLANSYKTKFFNSIDEALDLIHGLDFALKSKIRIDDIKINLLPKGEDLKANHIEDFFKGKKQTDKYAYILPDNIEGASLDDFLDSVLTSDERIHTYDVIISKDSKPIGIDLIQLRDVDKNLLWRVQKAIVKSNEATRIQMEKEGQYYSYISLKQAFYSLFGRAKQKYKSHLLKVLPKIYQDEYYEDPTLLHLFLERVEYGFRNDDKKSSYFFLKQYIYFLLQFQKNQPLMAIESSLSYQLGMQLGLMARPFSGGRLIKSFEKSYVGNLSRRINNVDDTIQLANYINEKLIIHGKLYPSVREAFMKFNAYTAEVSQADTEPYHRDYCAFGFFKGYYSPISSSDKEEVEADTEEA